MGIFSNFRERALLEILGLETLARTGACRPRVRPVPFSFKGRNSGEGGGRGPKCLSKLFWGPKERANISKLCRERAAKADYACSLYTFLTNQDDVQSFPPPANYISFISRHK